MLIRGDTIVLGANVQSPAEDYIVQGPFLVAAGAGAGAAVLQNLTGQDLLITDFYIDIAVLTAVATTTISVGVAATAPTAATNIINAFTITNITGVRSNHRDGGTGGGSAVWPNNQFVTVTFNNVPTSLVARFFLKAVPRPRA